MKTKDFDYILDQTDKAICAKSVKLSPKDARVVALFDLAHEHAKSISHLVNLQLLGSAFALLRSCIEAYVKGTWLKWCSSGGNANHDWSKDKWPKFDTMLKEIDAHDSVSYFSSKYQKSYGTMSKFTHALSMQTSRRIAGNVLKFSATDDEVTELLQECCFVSIMANLGIAEIIGNQSALAELEEIVQPCTGFGWGWLRQDKNNYRTSCFFDFERH